MLQLRKQKFLFPELDRDHESAERRRTKSGTFADNMKLPIHRWFRYSAGFSAEWVEREILAHKQNVVPVNVLDPFAGSATTLLAAESAHVKAVGFESHPFIHRVANAKLQWNSDIQLLRDMYQDIIAKARKKAASYRRLDVPLLNRCFTHDSLARLNSLRDVFLSEFDNRKSENEIIWLGITSIIRPCSTAGTAQWQYVLPNKKKSQVLEPFESFAMKMELMIEDINYAKHHHWVSNSEILKTDARHPGYKQDDLFDLVITSPPYANNYDYADATRLEMTFWGQIQGWKDLHSSVRQYLLRSCSQHSAKEKLKLDALLQNDILLPIKEELTQSCRALEKIRLTKGGKKTYHTMVAAYFTDLAVVFNALRPICKKGCKMCFVIGDSAPYGVYLPVDKWLGELAVSSGFNSYTFEKIRDRNIKWKNRKHRVPLHEGRLWIEG